MKLTLNPGSYTFDIDENQNVFEFLRSKKVELNSSCGGVASCGLCKVIIQDDLAHCNEPTFEESKLLGNIYHLTKERLACQVKLVRDCAIDISGHDQALDKLYNDANQKPKTVRRTAQEKEQIIQERKDNYTPKKDNGGKKRPRRFDYKK